MYSAEYSVQSHLNFFFILKALKKMSKIGGNSRLLGNWAKFQEVCYIKIPCYR